MGPPSIGMALRVGGGVSKRDGGMKCIVPFIGVSDGTVVLNAFFPLPFISMSSDPFRALIRSSDHSPPLPSLWDFFRSCKVYRLYDAFCYLLYCFFREFMVFYCTLKYVSNEHIRS